MYLVPVNRHLVLRTLRLSRLESSHCFRLLRSWVRDENSSSWSLEANVRLVSSTYILTSERRLQFGMSCTIGIAGGQGLSFGHPTPYATNFRIYIVNNCNLSPVIEVASRKIQTCTPTHTAPTLTEGSHGL